MADYKIPFNRPVYLESMMDAIKTCLHSAHMAGDGPFTKKCEAWIREQIGGEALLCSSATHALEMMALLIELKDGDEVILPSFTFVSTANAFALRGAKLRFADIDKFGNICPEDVSRLLTPKTKAVVAVDYAGNAPDYDSLMKLCRDSNVLLLEDAAQALGSKYHNKALGSFGALSCFSFHETKNVNCGEGGCLVINDLRFMDRAHILREKGTNRKNFFLGKVDKYSWVDIGSSYLCSDLNAAILYPQLLQFNEIQSQRELHWKKYFVALKEVLPKVGVRILEAPEGTISNHHIFALIMNSEEQRKSFISWMRNNGIDTPFHYVSLHTAPYAKNFFKEERKLPNTEIFSTRLVRLPMHFNLVDAEQDYVIDRISSWVNSQR